ncbi:MAG: GHMP family kinase ATP-binding protein [Bryobacteraceae bacterium]
MNFAIRFHAHCRIELRKDRRFLLRARDLGFEEEFASLDALRAKPRTRLPLHAEVVGFLGPQGGLSIETDCEAPAGAGLAGSSTVLIALASALNALRGERFSREQLRQTAQNLEARIIRVPTGCQDYYPALYGGVNAIELGVDRIRRHAIPVALAELNQRFVLVYTGVPRQSGINNWEVMKAHIDGSRRVHRNFDEIAAIARAMRSALEHRDWEEAGRLLRAAGSLRRRNAPGITTPLMDAVIGRALRAGALGAKVCGAGGGGCLIVLCPPETRERVAEACRQAGGAVLDVTAASQGVRVRRVPQ